MLRVKDIEKSLKFYQDTLGMSLVRQHEAAAAGFNLYFLAYPASQGLPTENTTSQREGLLELTWNYGTEKDEEFKYHNGNDKPQGFGHICKFENGRCEGRYKKKKGG
jgi:lactoylglutathione lyase